MQEETHINVMPQGEQLSVLNGEVREPWYANEEGLTIESIFEYISRRDLDPLRCYAVADYSNYKLALLCHEGTPDRVRLYGAIAKHPDLTMLGINSNTQYQSDELMRFLRTKKRLFAKAEDFDTVMKSLTSFKARIVTLTERTDDRAKGQQSQTIDKFVDGADVVGAAFRRMTFLVNLLRGSGKELITVEVGIIPTSNGVSMFLECLDLDSMVDEAARHRMQTAVDQIREKKIPVLEK